MEHDPPGVRGVQILPINLTNCGPLGRKFREFAMARVLVGSLAYSIIRNNGGAVEGDRRG
jgi:hypothetical protein